MIRLGYHPATYIQHGIAADDAIRDMASAGWQGYEWSPSCLEDAYNNPAAYLEKIGQLNIEVSGVYCSCGFTSPDEIRTWQETVERTIEFARAGGTNYVLLDGGRRELGATSENISHIAELANEAGRRIVNAGFVCTWHQHWGTIFEYPAEFSRLMAETDPAFVRFTPDTAQLALGGFDLIDTFEQYAERMCYVHFKDLGEDRRFTELGTGTIEFHPLSDILRDADFDGWIVTDLDYTSLAPTKSSRDNLEYLHSLGF